MARGQPPAFLMRIGQQPGEPSRRSIYDADLHCQMVRDLAQQGKFPESWCAAIGVTMQTMRDWVLAYPEFKDAVIIARHLLTAYWTEYVHTNLKNPDLKQGLLVELLRKRFPEIWGKSPRDMWAFIHSEDVAQSIAAAPGGQAGAHSTPAEAQPLRGLSDDDLQAKLAALRARRAVEEEGKK